MTFVCASKFRLDVMPNGNLAIEIGDCDAVLILTPEHARKMATRIRTLLSAEGDLIDERHRINQALAHHRRQSKARRPSPTPH